MRSSGGHLRIDTEGNEAVVWTGGSVLALNADGGKRGETADVNWR